MSTSLKTRQVFIFFITWLSYASTYLLRKPLGVIKPDLEKTLHLKKTEMGWLDAALLLPYAVMQMLLGGIGDKIGARKALTICLIGSAFSMVKYSYFSDILCFMQRVMFFIRKQQKFYSLPKRYKQIRRFEQRPFVETSNLFVSLR